jgi:hypothetical protein
LCIPFFFGHKEEIENKILKGLHNFNRESVYSEDRKVFVLYERITYSSFFLYFSSTTSNSFNPQNLYLGFSCPSKQ